MKLLNSTPTKFFAVILISISNFILAQSTDPNWVPGTHCANCPVSPPDKNTNPTIMNGNQSNVTSYTASACGLNYVYVSVKLGKRAPLGGVTQPAGMVISGLPTGCTNILKAFLYTDASGNGVAITATVTNPALVPTAFPMTLIGSGPDKCWSYSGSHSYRADITSCITGNGTYSVSGLPTNPPITGNDCDGATILIIYSDPSQTYTGHMTIADGAHVAAPGTATNVISIPAACANSTFAEGIIIVADLQSVANTQMRFNSATTNYTFPAAAQSYFNVVTTTVSPVTAGQTTSIFGVGPSTSDCFNVVMSALYYRTTCNTCTFSPGSMSLTAASSSSCTTGTATATPIGGTGPYTYLWSPTSATTQTISGAPGIYTVTVKDAACAQVTTTVSISALTPITINTNINQPSCLFPPGIATATVSGGATATSFTVTWSPTPGTVTPTGSGSIATGLTAGTNTAVVVDANGCSTSTTFTVSTTAATSFSINSTGSLTCTNPAVTITAVNTSTLGSMTYTWLPGNLNGSSITATATGVYTVTGQDLVAGSCALTQTFAIAQNTTVPSTVVNPISQVISCNGGCKTFTASTPSGTANIVGTWYDPAANPMVVSGTPMLMCANSPGTYTAQFCSTINGCCSSQTVSVTSNTSVPTISVTSVFGFVINCTRPCLPMSINSSGTLAPTTYTWTNLTTSVSTSPLNGGFTVCTSGANGPGSYEAAFMDGNFCKVTTTINVTIDTLRPTPLSMTNLPSNSYTITCFTPSLIATGFTNPLYAPSSYSWTQPGPFIINSNTINIGTVNIPGPTGSSVTYTVIAMGPNGCIGKQKVNFYKDSYIPPYGIAFTPTAITCANPCVAVTATTVPSTTTGITYTFTSPPPTVTATTAGVLMCNPGTYTMTYMNVNNGCKSTSVTTVPLNVTPPATFALTDATISCGAISTTLNAGHTGSASATTYSYNWSGPPLSGMSCPGGIGCYSTTANAPGLYSVTILNTINGCVATNTVFIVPGTVDPSIASNYYSGFAPLTVNFGNTTNLGSATAGTVTTTWIYGNGITQTFTGTSASYSLTGPPGGSTTYQSAGTYTVYLIVSQTTGAPLGPGMPPNACIGTYSAIVFVELPSQLVIPNVFTPNGDGVNDAFFLQTTNLTEITCLIYDRWGVKMYDVTSDKGNISWNGQNFANKDVPAGTYFYIIKAKGKDLKDYEYHGTISLFR